MPTVYYIFNARRLKKAEKRRNKEKLLDEKRIAKQNAEKSE